MNQPNHPWNPLPRQDMGDANDDVLYAAIGRALSAWEYFENLLGDTFAGLCGARVTEGAERAYGVVSSFTGRRDMVDAAWSCHPQRGRPELADLPKTLERAKQFAARRNEIAHGVVIGWTVSGKPRGFYLCPASYNSRKRPSRQQAVESAADDETWMRLSIGNYAYTAEQVLYYRDQFSQLRTDIARANHFVRFGPIEDQKGDASGV